MTSACLTRKVYGVRWSGVARLMGVTMMALGTVGMVSYGGTAAGATVTAVVSIADKGITLTLSDASAEFSALDPGQTGNDVVSGSVRSSKEWQLTYITTDLTSPTDTIPIEEVTLEGTEIPTPITLSPQGTIYSRMPKYPNPRNPFRFTHILHLTLPWTVDPGSYRGLILYSATQR